jgi:hypothetical protein
MHEVAVVEEEVEEEEEILMAEAVDDGDRQMVMPKEFMSSFFESCEATSMYTVVVHTGTLDLLNKATKEWYSYPCCLKTDEANTHSGAVLVCYAAGDWLETVREFQLPAGCSVRKATKFFPNITAPFQVFDDAGKVLVTLSAPTNTERKEWADAVKSVSFADEELELLDKIIGFYAEHNPGKLQDPMFFPKTMKRYLGREDGESYIAIHSCASSPPPFMQCFICSPLCAPSIHLLDAELFRKLRDKYCRDSEDESGDSDDESCDELFESTGGNTPMPAEKQRKARVVKVQHPLAGMRPLASPVPTSPMMLKEKQTLSASISITSIR